MRTRSDEDLAFMLKYENVAWYEDGKVRILDRRIYPREISYVECTQYKEVVQAIADMVTQSGGPYMACSMGMVLAAKNCESFKRPAQLSFLKQAAYDLSHARPTTSTRMVKIAQEAYLRAEKALDNENLIDVMLDYAIEEANSRYDNVDKRAQYLAEKIQNGFHVMTQCFPDAVIGMLCKHLKNQNKSVTFFTPETRPYFQGSRLTASVIADMGFEVYVITDNMTGITMSTKKIDLCLSAADMISMDGHVVNKIGTFNIALLAWYHHIPYYCLGVPNKKHESIDSVEIEERSGNDVLYIGNTRYVHEKVKAYYPLFDITPPHLISGIVTEKGILSPYNLVSYYK